MNSRLLTGVVGIATIAPFVASASDWLLYTGGTQTLLDTYVFWSTIVLAGVAIGLVFSNAAKMKGGVFGSTLCLFGSGMLVTFLGYLVMSFANVLPDLLKDLLPDVLFIIGYVLMAIAASRLARAIAP
jgi:hypothetical protein